MDERLRFVARLLEGEKRALLCGDLTPPAAGPANPAGAD